MSPGREGGNKSKIIIETGTAPGSGWDIACAPRELGSEISTFVSPGELLATFCHDLGTKKPWELEEKLWELNFTDEFASIASKSTQLSLKKSEEHLKTWMTTNFHLLTPLSTNEKLSEILKFWAICHPGETLKMCINLDGLVSSGESPKRHPLMNFIKNIRNLKVHIFLKVSSEKHIYFLEKWLWKEDLINDEPITDNANIIKVYLGAGFSVREIAETLECSRQNIYYIIKKYNLNR